MGGAAQVDRSRYGVVEQRRGRRRLAVDRAFRAGIGSELHSGADRDDVVVLEELRPRQGDRRRRNVGIARARFQHCPEFRMGAAFRPAEEAEGELGLEAQVLATGRLEAVGDRSGGSLGSLDQGVDRHRFAAGRSRCEVRSVEGNANVSHVQGDPVE